MTRRTETSRPSVVVVGAGILGSSIAFHLAHRGAQVTLLEAGSPGQGATRLSFAWINASSKSPYPYHDLNRRSLATWDRFVRLLSRCPGVDTIDLRWGGELRWAVTEEGATRLVERARELQRWGYPTQLLSRAEVARLEPELPLDDLIIAGYNELEGHVDTGQVVRACLAGLTQVGATVGCETALTGFAFDSRSDGRSHVVAVRSGNQTLPCDAVVLAGGADTDRLAGLAGLKLPLRYTRGITLVTEPLPPLFHTVSVLHSPRDQEPRINVRQFSDGRVMIQGSPAAGDGPGDRGENNDEIAALMDDAASFLPPLGEATVQEVRRGRRPIPEDGEPILGFSHRVPNLYLAVTHSGVTLAPLIGEMAAIEIGEGVSVDLLQPYRLARFGR